MRPNGKTPVWPQSIELSLQPELQREESKLPILIQVNAYTSVVGNSRY